MKETYTKQTKREWWEGNKQRLTPPHVLLYHRLCAYSDGPPTLVNLGFTLITAIGRALFPLSALYRLYYG